jgi:hypothetical protein
MIFSNEKRPREGHKIINNTRLKNNENTPSEKGILVISSDLATPDLPAHLREQRNCLLCARCLLHACIRRVSAITQRASAARRRQGVSWVAGKRVRCAAAVLNRAAILAASHMACARARRRKILSFAVSRQCRAANASVNRPKYAPRAILSTAASTMSPRARLTRCVSAQSVHMHQPHGHTVIRSYGHTVILLALCLRSQDYVGECTCAYPICGCCPLSCAPGCGCFVAPPYVAALGLPKANKVAPQGAAVTSEEMMR